MISAEDTDTHVVIAAVWVNHGADDADAVYRNNRTATFEALRNGSLRLPLVDDVLAARATVTNPFYTPPA